MLLFGFQEFSGYRINRYLSYHTRAVQQLDLIDVAAMFTR